jgi:hypothetical protein
MACDTYRSRKDQTLAERMTDIRRATARLAAALAAGSIKVRVGAQGAIAFDGWKAEERDGMTDACAYRRLLAEGDPSLRRALATEAAAGRTANRQIIGQGVHSHDGGHTWHPGHK